MNIAHAGFEILPRDEEHGGLALVALAGHTCHKSEMREDDEYFVRGLVRRHHDSVLEHGEMIFEVDSLIYEMLSDILQDMRDNGRQAPRLELTWVNAERCIVSGNIRAWREFFANSRVTIAGFTAHFHPVWLEGLHPNDDWDAVVDSVRPIRARELREPAELLTHERVSVRFIIDRGISHEFVRHRMFSFSQESTRYCNYSEDRFGNEISVIEPCYLTPGSEAHGLWWRHVINANVSYAQMLRQGCTPQEARAVLPTSTKTELVMTGNLAAWQHFFDLRAKQTTGKAHPQAVEVAQPLYEVFRGIYPGIIE